jgi:hypothetical protein
MITEAKEAILKATKAFPHAKICVELFEDGYWRVTHNPDAETICIPLPTLESDEWDVDNPYDSFFDNATDTLEHDFKAIKQLT